MNTTASHKSYWAMQLILLLQDMAALRTNAVLNLLSGVSNLQPEGRYPESGMLFADGKWRAFYHCHEATSVQSDEHGYFHLFTDSGDQQWSHVAGLSISKEGQPLRWFSVNRWVTDSNWLERKDLTGHLKKLPAKNKEDSLTASWLLVMLQLYADDLQALLAERDEQIRHSMQGRSLEEILEDRELYMLSSRAIDLTQIMEQHLLYERAEDA